MKAARILLLPVSALLASSFAASNDDPPPRLESCPEGYSGTVQTVYKMGAESLPAANADDVLQCANAKTLAAIAISNELYKGTNPPQQACRCPNMWVAEGPVTYDSVNCSCAPDPAPGPARWKCEIGGSRKYVCCAKNSSEPTPTPTPTETATPIPTEGPLLH